MSQARVRSSAVAVLVGFAAICIALWLLRRALDSEPPPEASLRTSAEARPAGAAPPGPAPAAASSASRSADPELPPAAPAAQLDGSDTLDPCSAPPDPEPPSGFETTTSDGVTVAWQPGTPKSGPYDVALPPVAIAYLVKGLLAEAAALTATPRRDRILVVVYPSTESFRAATQAPGWSDGVYNGAVSVPARPGNDLGIDLASLRHELMHAQLHGAVGCMPAWLNEGLAMYFAGEPPVRAWLKLLRTPDAFDLGSLQGPTFAFLARDRAERAYAESLAMIVYLVEHAGEPGIQTAIRTLRMATRTAPRAGLDLWDRLYPAAGHRALADALAHKLFGIGPGGELDAILQGAVCCSGVRAVGELSCRGAPPRPDRKFWIDRTSSPRALCDTTW